jgi:hypothetical protein
LVPSVALLNVARTSCVVGFTPTEKRQTGPELPERERFHIVKQNQGYDPGEADGLFLADVLFLADPPVELVQPEVVPPTLTSQRRRELIRELGGEVVRLVTCEPL